MGIINKFVNVSTMKLKKDIKYKINYIFDVLKKNDIKVLDVSFGGGGDQGHMEIDGYDGPDHVCFDEPTIFQDDLEDLIFDVAVHILDKRGIDYANGFGNEGNVYFEVEKKQISMNYLVTTDECYSFNV